jgi:16S rRNA (adenine1518-N6/adenine1519-N6)-dimethyltransferase
MNASQDLSLPSPRSPRQTLSYLREIFQERGIRPKNKLGQNFLIDLNLLELIVRAAELTHDDLALEIGSGTGSLTGRLAHEAGAVLSVELDPSFYELVRDAVAESERVVLMQVDALRRKNEMNPGVIATLETLQARSGCKNVKLVSNLPYAVAVPVISNLLLSDRDFARMVVTVQWEIAERLMAHPNTKDYGALAVLVQSLADVSLVRKLPPSVFWPRPKVASAIVRIVPNRAKRAHVVEQAGSLRRFRFFLRDLYVHRRKNLRGALVGLPNGRHSKPEVDRKLAELGIEGTARAEDLDVEHHLRLCAAFGEEVATATDDV